MCKHVTIQHEIQNSNNFQMVYLNYKTKSTINRVHDKEQVTRTVQYVDMWRVGGESRYNFIEIKMPESDAACCAAEGSKIGAKNQCTLGG